MLKTRNTVDIPTKLRLTKTNSKLVKRFFILLYNLSKLLEKKMRNATLMI